MSLRKRQREQLACKAGGTGGARDSNVIIQKEAKNKFFRRMPARSATALQAGMTKSVVKKKFVLSV